MQNDVRPSTVESLLQEKMLYNCKLRSFFVHFLKSNFVFLSKFFFLFWFSFFTFYFSIFPSCHVTRNHHVQIRGNWNNRTRIPNGFERELAKKKSQTMTKENAPENEIQFLFNVRNFTENSNWPKTKIRL